MSTTIPYIIYQVIGVKGLPQSDWVNRPVKWLLIGYRLVHSVLSLVKLTRQQLNYMFDYW